LIVLMLAVLARRAQRDEDSILERARDAGEPV
jgi:hypothetical protein